MAIKVQGITVIDDSRDISNIGIATVGILSVGSYIYDANGVFGTTNQVLTSVPGIGVSWADESGGGSEGDKIEEGNTSAEVVDTGSNGHFKVTTEGIERLRIDSSGNVGIGTDNPNEKLEVAANSSHRISVRATDTTMSDTGDYGGFCWYTNDASNPNRKNWDIYQKASGSTGTTDLHINSFSTNDIVVLDSSGNIGIGTDSPVRPLHITSSDCRIRLEQTGETTDVELLNSNGNAILTTNGESHIRLQTDNAERMRILSTGEVGINTTTPTATLDVDGTLNVSGVSTFQGDAYFGDNDRLRLGDGQDLQIYHGSLNSYIRDIGTGNLLIRSDGSGVRIQKDGGDNMGVFNTDGSVDLYYAASKKFETTGAGVTITGIATATTFQAPGGTYASGTDTRTDAALVIDVDSAILTEHGGEYLRNLIENDGGAIKIGQSGTSLIGSVNLYPGNNGTTNLYHGGANKKLQTTTSGIEVTGTTDTDQLNVSGVSTFQDNVFLGDDDQLIFGDGSDLKIYHNSSNNNSIIQETGSGNLNINADNLQIRNSAGNEVIAVFRPDDSVSLNYDNSKKFETTGYGVTVSGGVYVSGISTFQDNIEVTGNIEFDNITTTGAATATLTTLTETPIHTGLSASTYRSVEYTIQATEGTNFHSAKVLVVHDGTTAYHSEYGTIYNNTPVATFNADVSGGNLRLLAAGESSNSTVYKIHFIATKV